MSTLNLTDNQVQKLINTLVWAKDAAEIEILKDKRRANDSMHATIELAEQLLTLLRGDK